MEDWRITNQERFLKNKLLIHKKYSERKTKSDHDHCEFCMDKFGEFKDVLKEGYCTEDEYYWICNKCFHDFKDAFLWKVINE